MSVEHGIISSEPGGIISRSIAVGSSLGTHSPPVIFIPVGIVVSTNIGHTPGIGFSDDGFTKAHRCIKSIGQAAITHHHTVLVGIGHGVYITHREGGIAPRGLSTMGSIVHIASALVGIGDNGCITGPRYCIEIGIRSDTLAGIKVV